METVYGEKEALDDALTSVKTATGNYNTFSNECVHENVRNVMLKILEQEHEIQDDVFKIMHDKGLYPTPEAESKKVEQAKQKFARQTGIPTSKAGLERKLGKALLKVLFGK